MSFVYVKLTELISLAFCHFVLDIKPGLPAASIIKYTGIPEPVKVVNAFLRSL